MKKKLTKKDEPTSRAELNPCVWMTAGVISYKLCPFNYDCEHCDFDKVMRLHTNSSGLESKAKRYKPKTALRSENLHTTKQESEEPFFTFSAGEVDQRLHIHPTHLWARQEYGHTWKVGVDKLLAYILPLPIKVELYRPNQEIIQEEAFGRILTEAGTVFVTAPLSGRLVQMNPRLTKHPELVQQDPYGAGWLAMLDWSKDPSELEKLHPGAKGKKFQEEEAQHLKTLLRYRGGDANPVGRTMPDGGTDIEYLHQILPAKLCLRLVREVIFLGKEMW